jgi:hypothetical protein
MNHLRVCLANQMRVANREVKVDMGHCANANSKARLGMISTVLKSGVECIARLAFGQSKSMTASFLGVRYYH